MASSTPVHVPGYAQKRTNKVLDPASRQKKARKICAILKAFTDRPLQNLTCLDIGCGGGLITQALGEHLGRVVGIDVYEPALVHARTHAARPNVSFQLGDAMDLPFQNESFDLVIANHVYEHVPDPRRLVAEIGRVLKPDGFCYFPACNKFSPVEPHHHLPFLSWLPRSLAGAYARIFRKGDELFYERFLSLWGLRRLLSAYTIHDFTLKVIQDPERFEATDILKPGSFKTRLVQSAAPLAYPFLPTFLWVLTKRSAVSNHKPRS